MKKISSRRLTVLAGVALLALVTGCGTSSGGGSSTVSVVDLDAGPTLTVSHQNTDSSIDPALERRDQRVVLTWRRDHLVSLGPAPAGPVASPEEETA